MKKQIGFIGLGRMGLNMVARLLEKGYEVVAYDLSEEAVAEAQKLGAMGVFTVEEFVAKLSAPRTIWIMIPAQAVESALDELVPFSSVGDLIIEGGNTYYEESKCRARELEDKGIGFLDVGVSGGIEGARRGACIMVGGRKEDFLRAEQIFVDLSVPYGYGYMGKSGAGHFVKMVHNAIEYGMVGAIAESLQAIEAHRKEFGTDLGEVVKVYGHGSIIAGRLVGEWLAEAWRDNPNLTSFDGDMPYGETEDEMKKLEAQAFMPVLAAALALRAEVRKKPSFAGKVINALRFYWGGHTRETASKKQ